MRDAASRIAEDIKEEWDAIANASEDRELSEKELVMLNNEKDPKPQKLRRLS